MSTGTIRRRLSAVALAVWVGSFGTVNAQDLDVRSIRVPRDQFPVTNVDAKVWSRAPETVLPLLPQTMVAPFLIELTIPDLSVRSVNDGERIAFRLEWKDPTKDEYFSIDGFPDGVALEFPPAGIDPAQVSPFMGNPGARVQVLHWKAAWQKDIDHGRQEVKDLHPNAWSDIYPFVEGAFPFLTEASLESRTARNYMPGTYVGNPLSLVKRKTPVEELMAEGFGTLTTQPQQDADGKGAWNKGVWTVVLVRPLISPDPLDNPIPNGGQTSIAFAVWNGSDQDRGARKHYFPWVPLVVGE